jgi:hypothetical protein
MANVPEGLIQRVIELSGGKAALNLATDQKLAFINEKWSQDVITIGRILRAHLFVEYFMTDCLSSISPNLGSLEKAKLSFSQKVSLFGDSSAGIGRLLPGIKRLNAIRNRIAHTLRAEITEEDISVILSDVYFKALRNELAKPGKPSCDKLDVIEDFAKHVGSCLESEGDPNSLSKRFAQAFEEFGNET